MKRILVAIGLGVLGATFALGLTVGALAVAGPDVGEPPVVPILDQSPDPSPSPSTATSKGDGRGNGDDDRSGGKQDDRTSPGSTPSPTPSTDDHAGSSDDGSSDDSGSEDHGHDSGSEDHEEPDDD